MLRSRARSRVLIVAVLAGLTLVEAACGSSSPEAQLLNNFFRAARVRDNTTLANISAVSFNPRTEGTVEDFEVVSVGPERGVAVQISALADEEAKAKACSLFDFIGAGTFGAIYSYPPTVRLGSP